MAKIPYDDPSVRAIEVTPGSRFTGFNYTAEVLAVVDEHVLWRLTSDNWAPSAHAGNVHEIQYAIATGTWVPEATTDTEETDR